MTLSTNLISGLASGFDWRTMIDQLIAVERRKVNIVEDQKSEYEAELSAWQSFNSDLLALKTAAEALKDPEDFYVYTTSMSTDSSTVDGDDLLSVSTSSSASPATYRIKVTNLAQAQKLSSNPFTSQNTELGAAYAGDIVINGKVITINSTDTLADVANTINNANTGTDPSGVTASIVNYGTNDYRLILTSDSTGADGISLLNGSSTNLVQKFGWKDNQTAVIKNSITQGAQSDRFTAANVAVKSLLGLASGESSTGSLTIDGTAVTIDLSTDSLTDIKDAINTAMAGAGKGSDIVATVVSETEDNTTYYRLQIEGTQSFQDENNILNTLGILDHTSASVSGKVSGNSMTTEGSYITADTLLVDIDGYISYDAADNIQMTGTKTGGSAVNHTFNISATTTVQDLLDEIETQYATNPGDVIAYVTSDGKIRVDDVAGGGSLSVTLTDNITNGQLEFVNGDAAFGNATARDREIVAGEDAAVEIDGVQVTNSSNIIDDVIEGVTLNLIKEDGSTTVTLNIDRDIDTIKSNIENFVSKYNTVISYINTQFSYDEDAQQTGGVLFGDSTLLSVKSDVVSLVTESIWGVDSDYSTLGLVGINADKNMKLTVDDTVLTGYLQTNFNDVMALFVGQGITSSSLLTYIGHSRESEAGEYTVHINRAAARAAETGNVDLSSGGADETLTITQGSDTATITITSGMTLSDIINEINTELDQDYAKTLVGDQQLKESGSAITAETKWANIDGTSLQNNDVISFSGTTRIGIAVSGSYTISDVNTDTVQGLLSAIEDAFSSEVSASIDTSGRLVVTEKTVGDSQISITITEPSGRGLDFGTIDITAGAGDGSQEGRYALSITATDDGSNHLVLRSDEYGASSFTISQDTSDNNYDHILYTTTSNTTASTDGTVYITETITWADVYGANVANSDTITIAGKARDGTTDINGTYTINDASTDTVQGLLTAIENAYSAQGTVVDAFLRDGKIYVEDTTAGASSISLTLTANNEGGGSLTLGTFQTTERDLDLGLINGTVSGLDVAGTINGESATGNGRVLTGDDGNVNTEGLSVEYTGTSNDVDAGTIKLTIGVAELYERVLYNIIDSIDGYATFTQESLQDNINRIEEKIEEMEERLDKKTEMMINRFVQLELALSQIQNQSNWLTGQINAAAGAWR
ncbi:MAG: flagellar filament capping protein FliD [Deltaproteobacteria bacterium]|nr:flagellar filament capping protein FliD [Deltaproteobacteria bacterium]